MKKKKAKTKVNKKEAVEVDVQPVKWQPGDERKPQGYWTDKYLSEYDGVASRLIAVGFNEIDLSNTFNVPESAIKGWKRSFPSFKKACNEGKRGQLKRLASSILKEAEGYDWMSTKIKTEYDAKGNVVKVEKQDIPMHQAGNANLAIFAACNISNQLKLPDEEAFKSRQKVEVENKNLNVNISAELIGDQIDRLAGKLLSCNAKQIEAEVVEQETK
jgi:hypothetical protein